MDHVSIILLFFAIAAVVVAAVSYIRWKTAVNESIILRQQLVDLRQNDDRFKAMAAEVLRQNSTDLLTRNSADLGALINPLRENIGKFEQNIAECYSREARERFALDSRVRQLMEISRNVGEETRRLSEALKGNNKVQGDWGETVLETLLNRAGLQEGREFETQKSVVDGNGRRLRPDVVLRLPDDRFIVIDSKVSMKAYFDLRDAHNANDIQCAKKALLNSVRSHIAELRNKNYQDATGDRRADFVLMFIPHEGAYMSAIEADPRLCEMAFDCRVLPVSPTHLMAVLSLIDQIWRQERQERNAEEIAAQAGRMLDKLEGFINDMQRIDKAISASKEAYDSAMNKLSEGKGNLINRAAALRELGAKTKNKDSSINRI
ncbi:MAG: DNA recombination protein RmuC [Muribaculaceae bacterium]|nr:DNA recombination protein RmuC [Muribaculaceae bacterium]